MHSLWYTGYLVSSLTLLALVYVEWEVPGFVSSVFPIYLVVIVAFICGVGALVTSSRAERVYRASYVFALAVGVVGSLVVFQAAEAMGAYRLMMAILVLTLPLLLLKALGDVKE